MVCLMSPPMVASIWDLAEFGEGSDLLEPDSGMTYRINKIHAPKT